VLEFFVAVMHPVDFEGEVDVILELEGNPSLEGNTFSSYL
jgi:hypothetical protein